MTTPSVDFGAVMQELTAEIDQVEQQKLLDERKRAERAARTVDFANVMNELTSELNEVERQANEEKQEEIARKVSLVGEQSKSQPMAALPTQSPMSLMLHEAVVEHYQYVSINSVFV